MKMHLSWLLFATLFVILSESWSNVLDPGGWTPSKFSLSNFRIRHLAQCEFGIFKFLKAISTKRQPISNEVFTETLHRYLQDFESSTGSLDGFNSTVAGNIGEHPLLAFRMIFRFVHDLPKISIVAGERYDFTKRCEWPLAPDLNEAMDGILRLSFMLDLNVTEFASGQFQGKSTKFSLESRHVMVIGRHARRTYHALTIEWLELATVLLQSESSNNEDAEPKNALENNLIKAVLEHDEAFSAARRISPKLFVKKLMPYQLSGLVWRTKQRSKVTEIWGGISGPQFRELNYWALCSCELPRKNASVKTGAPPLFFCWINSTVPIFPFQFEQISAQPDIFLIHNVISIATANYLIDAAEPYMTPSAVHIPGEGFSMSESRTSYTTWLPSLEFPISAKLENLIEIITGLHLRGEGSEFLQIASYTSFGAHYDVHMDEDNKFLSHPGDTGGPRLATFMIYLTDVEAGGQTAFVDALVAAKPKRGNALFWYNLDSFGNLDERTYHGACPLLQGSKWVANKWIRYNPQFNARKCPVKLKKARKA